MKGTTTFQWSYGDYDHRSMLTTKLPLGPSLMDDPDTMIPLGKVVTYDASHADQTEGEMLFAEVTSPFFYFLYEDLTLSGLTLGEGFKQQVVGFEDPVIQPKRRDVACSARFGRPGSQIIAEGLGVATPNNLVVTTGAKAITVGTAAHTLITAEGGSLGVAASGDWCLGTLVRSLTPNHAGNVRVMINLISPILMA